MRVIVIVLVFAVTTALADCLPQPGGPVQGLAPNASGVYPDGALRASWWHRWWKAQEPPTCSHEWSGFWHVQNPKMMNLYHGGAQAAGAPQCELSVEDWLDQQCPSGWTMNYAIGKTGPFGTEFIEARCHGVFGANRIWRTCTRLLVY